MYVYEFGHMPMWFLFSVLLWVWTFEDNVLFFPGCMQARMVLKKVKNFRKLMFQLLYFLL